MANGIGVFGPALQAIGASLMSGGDLTQTGQFLPQFEQARANAQTRALQAQRARQQIAATERQQAQEAALLDAVRGGQGAFGNVSEGQRAFLLANPAVARSFATKALERELFPAQETPLQAAQRRKAEAEANLLEVQATQPGAGRKAPEGFQFASDGTLKAIPGGPKDLTRTKEFRDGARQLGRLSRDLTAYRNALTRKGGTDRLSLTNRRRLSRLHTNLLLQMKNAEELGVLAGPDLDLLRAQLLDPTAVTTDRTSLLEGVNALQNRIADDTEQFRVTFEARPSQLRFKALSRVQQGGRAVEQTEEARAGAPARRPRQASTLDQAVAQMNEGDIVRDNTTGQRLQLVNGRLVPVDPTAAFAGFGVGGGA